MTISTNLLEELAQTAATLLGQGIVESAVLPEGFNPFLKMDHAMLAADGLMSMGYSLTLHKAIWGSDEWHTAVFIKSGRRYSVSHSTRAAAITSAAVDVLAEEQGWKDKV